MPTFTLRVFRGTGGTGGFQEYRVAAEEGMVVLDVIHRLQATQATDLAVRWNCKAGKCGSCSAEIDGKPRLMCMTRMDLFRESEPITVAPIRGFPLIRDLVTNLAYNYEKAKEIPPLRLKAPEPDGTYRRYFLRVPPRMRTARQAVAWTFGVDRAKDYSVAFET